MPDLSTIEGRVDRPGNFEGAPVGLLFCIAGSLLALYLTKPPALLFLGLASTVQALRLVEVKLMLKVYLAFAILLALCLTGAAWLPMLGPFPAGRIPADQIPGLSIKFAVLPALRMLVSANLLISLVMSSSFSALMRLMSTLARPDWLFIPLSVAVRFVGTFIAELALVREALIIRTRQNLFRTVLTRPWLLWRGFLVPMTFRALGGADDLAIAVDMKGIKRKAMTWPGEKFFKKKDIPVLLSGLATIVMALFLQLSAGVPQIMPSVSP
jgi:energy-coupling factor transporter transmembrane protein EcfT